MGRSHFYLNYNVQEHWCRQNVSRRCVRPLRHRHRPEAERRAAGLPPLPAALDAVLATERSVTLTFQDKRQVDKHLW